MQDFGLWLNLLERVVIIVGIIYSVFTTNKAGIDVRAAVDALSATTVTGTMGDKQVNLKTETPPDVPKS